MCWTNRIVWERMGNTMKRFEAPVMSVDRLDTAEVIATSSGCWEAHECKNCYCGVVDCDDTWSCNKVICAGVFSPN